MSDGLNEGRRWAEEHEGQQRKIDAFFAQIIVLGQAEKLEPEKLRKEFDLFDAIRYGGHIARGRLEKERGKRWEAFQQTVFRRLDLARFQTHQQHLVWHAWAEVLALAFQFASPKVVEELRRRSPYERFRIALYVPNGRGRAPSFYGDFAALLDTIAAKADDATRGAAYVLRLEDAERAVVGIEMIDGRSLEMVDPERTTLRFIAADKGVER